MVYWLHDTHLTVLPEAIGHLTVLEPLQPLTERGQNDGTFRADVPAEWHLSMSLARSRQRAQASDWSPGGGGS
jgi:hypothetical protein